MSVRLVIVDDAHFVRAGLRRLFEGDPDVNVVGTAATGEELLANVDAWRPDVITLDLNMPGIDGLETLDRLLAKQWLPVIILSTHSGASAPLAVEALARGAVDCVHKEAYSLVDFATLRAVLKKRIMHVAGPQPATRVVPQEPRPPGTEGIGPVEVVVIGASTGGPRAVEQILVALGPDFPVPVLVAQHMPPGFTEAFAKRLDRVVPLTVREAQDGARLSAKAVWIAPAGKEVRITRSGDDEILRVGAPPSQALYKPSIDTLFESAAEVYGGRAAGVLLTGMGDDGARGLAALRKAGAYTVAQDEATSVVWGMPRVAVNLGAARDVLALERIGPQVRALVTAGASEKLEFAG